MDPIPEKLKNLKSCYADATNGRTRKDLSLQMNGLNILNPYDQAKEFGEYHPLCCNIKMKFYHNSVRFVK